MRSVVSVAKFIIAPVEIKLTDSTTTAPTASSLVETPGYSLSRLVLLPSDIMKPVIVFRA